MIGKTPTPEGPGSSVRWPDNRLVLSGRVVGKPETRQSPAGLVIIRLTLEHGSGTTDQRTAAGCFRIQVRFTDSELTDVARHLVDGQSIRVSGRLAAAGHKAWQQTLEIHASGLQQMAIPNQ